MTFASASGGKSGDEEKSFKGKAQVSSRTERHVSRYLRVADVSKSFLAGLNPQHGPEGAAGGTSNDSGHHLHSGPALPAGADQPRPPSPQRRMGEPACPKVKGTPEIVGLVGDPGLNRDSGGSCRFGDRILWTYRDTQLSKPDGTFHEIPIITSTASWSELDSDGGPLIQQPSNDCDPLKKIVHVHYGDNGLNHLNSAFYPIHTPGTGRIAGNDEDGSRHPFWPDSPPLVTNSPNTTGLITAYTFIKVDHIKGLEFLVPHPPTTLYRLSHNHSDDSSKDSLPKVEIVDKAFWKEGEIQYGVYGNLIHESYAYLYAQFDTSNESVVALARVPTSQIEYRSSYEYLVNDCWTRDVPSRTTPGLNIANLNGLGQGTYYFCPAWNSFVWIGGSKFPGASCYITTAPDPTGPWTEVKKFWEGPSGTADLGAYSIQAHPAMGLGTEGRNWVWITYTKQDHGYSTPLVRVEWE